VIFDFFGACPLRLRFGVGLFTGRDVSCHVCTPQAMPVAGFPLLSLTQKQGKEVRLTLLMWCVFLDNLRIDARAGASPPPSQKHAYTIRKKCFLPHFHSGAGGRASPTPPQKNTSFALGMRRVRSRGVACNVSEAIA